MSIQHYPSTNEEPTLFASTRDFLKVYGQKYDIQKAYVFLRIVHTVLYIILYYIISFLLVFLVSKRVRIILSCYLSIQLT